MLFPKGLSPFYKLTFPIISALLVCSTVTGFIVLPQFFYYGALGVVGAWMLFQGGRMRFTMPLIAFFLLICTLSIFVNQPPSYFKAWQRLAGFTMIVTIMSPMVTSFKVSLLRNQLFNIIMWILVVISVGSLFCYFLGINFFVRNDEVLAIDAGHFSGLYRHSMLLGPCAALSSIFIFSYFLNERKRWQLFVLFCCIGSTFFSASRAAVAGCFTGLAVSYMRFYQGQISKALLIGLTTILLLAASFPIWGGMTEFVMEKQAANMEQGGTFNSREDIWGARMIEIKEHPIFGVGFACVDEKYTIVNKDTGNVEPGSSWLAVFSMTGLLGFLTLLEIYYKAFKRTWKNSIKEESCLFSGMFAFYAIHMIFEGYIMAAGSFMGLMFFLSLGNVWLSKALAIERG